MVPARRLLAALPLVVTLACGSDAETLLAASDAVPAGTPGHRTHPKKLEVYGRDITATWANVSVLHDGVPLDDARVVVNGKVIPSAATTEGGLYSGPLATPLSAGEKVEIEVARGEAVVTGKGRIPDAPVLTSPRAGPRSPGEDVAVAWTSPTDPDSFAVWATWSCGEGCGTGTSFEVDRHARTFTIPASALPDGQPVAIRVFAYDDGTLRRNYTPHAPYPGMNIRAESDEVTLSAAEPVAPALEVFGCDMGAGWVNVCVMRDHASIDDATVVVNGQLVPRWSPGHYHAMLDTPLLAGQTLALEVARGSSLVTGSGTVPDSPVLTSVTSSPATDVAVAWTSPTAPEYFEVSATWSCGPVCGTGIHFVADRAAGSLTIPASALPSGMDVLIRVYAYNDGTLGGDYTPSLGYPGMNIRAESDGIVIRR